MPVLRKQRTLQDVLLAVCLLAAAGPSGCALGSGQSRTGAVPGGTGPAKSAVLGVADRLSARDPTAVSVFPAPGTRYNLPGTQVSLRGIAPGRIGALRVVGSVTGRHRGHERAHSDGHGASFIPDTPFAPGETVTVVSRLDVLGGSAGRWRFAVGHPAPQIAAGKLASVAPRPEAYQRFTSRPDLTPAAVQVVQDRTPGSAGDMFVAPQNGPLQDGPMIVAPNGQLIWFHPTDLARRILTTDFRLQRLHGQPVLTWWQGHQNAGSGRGVGVIDDRHYRRIATVHAGNGLQADLHEFIVTPNGTAWLIAASPVALPGMTRPVIDSVIQQIDIRTGLVLFEWHALDHVGLSESYKYGSGVPGHVVDPYHMNSISIAHDGNLVVSMRNTSAVYRIDKRSGQVIWRLGGKDSSFTLGPGTGMAFQHSAIVQPDGTLTVFDNGAGPPKAHPFSRGIRVALDKDDATATLVTDYNHSPAMSANFEGGVQALPGGDVFLGYGQRPWFTEFDPSGQADFDARFMEQNSSYRAYRFPWRGAPLGRPRVKLVRGLAYVSWNGATDVVRWRVLGGARRGRLHRVAASPKRGFETAIASGRHRYLRVEAVGAAGRVLGRSRLVRVS